MQGNAEGSTLRLSLGCILADQLGIELRRMAAVTGSHSHGAKHCCRSGWKRTHECLARLREAGELEEELISPLNPPLNLDMNATNTFYLVLSELRRAGFCEWDSALHRKT